MSIIEITTIPFFRGKHMMLKYF